MRDHSAARAAPHHGGSPRRWPAAAVAVAVVVALALTVLLVLRDQQNEAAASTSRANAARDAAAVMTLQGISSILSVDAGMRDDGILGLRSIGVAALQSGLVTPLGGSLRISERQWTLALDGGWACLMWHRSNGTWATGVRRGVCPNDVIVSTPVVTALELEQAQNAVAAAQRAALDAASVAAEVVPASASATGRFSLAALTRRFASHGDVGFDSWATPVGETVAVRSSAACVSPSLTSDSVVITSGPCT